MKTKVIFRIYNDGQIIALFPQFTNSYNYTVTSYMHIGQHSDADYQHVVSKTKLATPVEYESLLSELKGIYKPEYELTPIKKCKVKYFNN